MKRRVANGTKSRRLSRSIFVQKEENGLGHLFITSSSSYFLNKTDFELHLSKNKFVKVVGS